MLADLAIVDKKRSGPGVSEVMNIIGEVKDRRCILFDDMIDGGGTLTNADVDNAQTFVAQTNVAGTNGTFSIAANGAWTYTANSAFDSLNVGQSVSDTFTVAAADGTTSTVQVTIPSATLSRIALIRSRLRRSSASAAFATVTSRSRRVRTGA